MQVLSVFCKYEKVGETRTAVFFLKYQVSEENYCKILQLYHLFLFPTHTSLDFLKSYTFP